MPAKLSTHVLDISKGCPAVGMQIELYSLAGDKRVLLKTTRTNAEGRTDQPLLSAEEMRPGVYELVYFCGDYFAETSAGEIPFLDRIPLRFGINEAHASYHVPLLVSPWAYSTYRGS
jgi:5-hydroxyisourate hydrolase